MKPFKQGVNEGTITFIITSLLVFVLTMEYSINNIFQVIGPTRDTLHGILILFASGIIISIVGQSYLIFAIKKIFKISFSKSPILRKNFYILIFCQLAISILLGVIAAQIITSLSFSLLITSIVFFITYSISFANISILLIRFVRWIINGWEYILLFNAVSSFAILANIVVSIIYVSFGLMKQPESIVWHGGPITAIPDPTLDLIYRFSSILAFITMWITSVVILRHYSGRQKIRFLLIASMPVIYLVTQFQTDITQFFMFYALENPIAFSIASTLAFSIGKTLGAILFGIGFWSTARGIEQYRIRSFMYLCSYGLILLFVSNQGPIILNYMFPPYGLITISLMGISSFLILIGIYATAISVANDNKLRASIKISIQANSNLLSKIGHAEMEHGLKKKIMATTIHLAEKISEETGIDSSMTEDEIIKYVHIAIDEAKHNRRKFE